MAKSYQRPLNADEKKRSAIEVIKALLNLNDIYEPMKRRFLSNCLWQITEAEGKNKYDLRYCSKGSIGLPRKQLRHDHVYRRKDMVVELLASPGRAGDIAKQAVGCVVTKAEHVKLTKLDKVNGAPDGWERYRQAGIIVIDRVTELPLDFT